MRNMISRYKLKENNRIPEYHKEPVSASDSFIQPDNEHIISLMEILENTNNYELLCQ